MPIINPLILFEGIDQVGKTNNIRKIHNHFKGYNPITCVGGAVNLSYPSPAYFGNIMADDFQKYDRDNLTEIMNHHYSFMEDFAIHKDSLINYMKRHTVLLDRYFYSNFAYLQFDFFNYCHNIAKFEYDSYEQRWYFTRLCKILENYYKDLVQPDLVIYLYNTDMKPKSDSFVLHGCFRASFIIHPPKDIVEIKGLQKDTFTNIEEALKQRGYI
jgi:thymidylate kinase